MNIKNLLAALFISSTFAACDSGGSPSPAPTPGGGSGGGTGGEPIESARGKIAYVGALEMEEGPHNLVISAANMYAKRDNKIFKLSISSPRNPSVARTFAYTHNIGNIYVKGSRLYAPALTENAVLEMDMDLNIIKKHELSIASFKPNSILIDMEGKWWIGGSNGSVGMLTKHAYSGGALSLEAQWTASSTNSNIESIVEKGAHILTSVPSGDVFTFQKSSLTSGPVHTTTFTHESGHEKWGRTLITMGNKAYWANWGAGFATLNISNPESITVSNILSNSRFKSQFPDAEGTNVYDVAYNTSNNLLCIANGWSGVLLIDPANPDVVVDYIDPQYFQNRCIATAGNYIYTGNISGGMSGDLKGIHVFEIK